MVGKIVWFFWVFQSKSKRRSFLKLECNLYISILDHVTINENLIRTAPALNGTELWSNLPFYIESIPYLLEGMNLIPLPQKIQVETNITMDVKYGTQIFLAANKDNLSDTVAESVGLQNWREVSDILHIQGPNADVYNYTLWVKDFVSRMVKTITIPSNESSIAIFVGQSK